MGVNKSFHGNCFQHSTWCSTWSSMEILTRLTLAAMEWAIIKWGSPTSLGLSHFAFLVMVSIFLLTLNCWKVTWQVYTEFILICLIAYYFLYCAQVSHPRHKLQFIWANKIKFLKKQSQLPGLLIWPQVPVWDTISERKHVNFQNVALNPTLEHFQPNPGNQE